jgi:hypothetical protein
VPIYVNASGLGLAQGILRFRTTCPGVPLGGLGPYLLAETCRAMALRYLALSPISSFNAALLQWERTLQLQANGYVSFHRGASLHDDERLHMNKWLSLGAPQRVPHTERCIIPLCVRGVPVGGLKISPRLDDSSYFDPVRGHWIEYADERLTCAALSPRLEATLWRAMKGMGVFILDGPKIGTLSPMAPAFAGAARYTLG